MNWIDFELDECEPFRLRDRHGYPKGDRLDIQVSGKAVIQYRATDDWWLDELHIRAGNGKFGKECESWHEQIFASDPLWGVMNEYLTRVARDDVELAIVRDMQARHDEQREAAE
jgi:hypothetical protein